MVSTSSSSEEREETLVSFCMIDAMIDDVASCADGTVRFGGDGESSCVDVAVWAVGVYEGASGFMVGVSVADRDASREEETMGGSGWSAKRSRTECA